MNAVKVEEETHTFLFALDSTMIAESYAVCERRDDVRAQWVGAEVNAEAVC